MNREMPDELEAHLRGGSALAEAYAHEPRPEPPHALDRAVLAAASGPRRVRSPCLAPLGLAATVLLSITVLSALVLKPREQHAERAQVVPVHFYSEEVPRRAPEAWLADIAALRRAGRYDEASQQMRRFRLAYPRFIVSSEE